MQEQLQGSKDTQDQIRPFARITARVISQDEIDRFGFIEGMKVGYTTTSGPEPESH